MAVIATDLSKIGIIKETTFGTQVSVASGMFLYGRVTINESRESIVSDDLGFAGKRNNKTLGRLTGTLSITCDLAYNQALNALIGGVMGTEANPVEVTASQGDYRHDIDLADRPSIFFTVAWLVEDDRVKEVASFKPAGFTVQQAANGKGTVTITGPYYRSYHTGASGVVNTAGNITGLTPPAYQLAVLGGTNHYFRINADGGAGLSNSNDLAITEYTFSIQRALDPYWALRAANTAYTTEPINLGDIEGRLSFTMASNDDAAFDFLSAFFDSTTYKAEIHMDGAVIAAGTNRSYKFQFPYLIAAGEHPGGFDLPAKNQRMLGSINLEMMKRSAAPTGMTGVTDLFRWVTVDTRTTKWTA